MRHRVAGRKFNKDTKHRQAMIMNLVRSLFLHGELTTTEAKAKETKRWADKILTKAKKEDTAARRSLHRFFGKRDVVNTLVDRIAPASGDRQSGFTTHEVVGKRRGDNVVMVKVSLLEKPDQLGDFKSGKFGTDQTKIAKSETKSKSKAKKGVSAKTSEEKSTGATKSQSPAKPSRSKPAQSRFAAQAADYKKTGTKTVKK